MSKPWLEHYDPGVPPAIGTYPSRTLLDFVSERAAASPDRTLLIFKGRRLSYREIDDASRALAAGLHELGVRAGDRVALVLPNCPQFIIAELAAWRIGAIVAPQNLIYTEGELEQSFAASQPRVVITLSLFYEKVKRCQAAAKFGSVIVTNIKEYLPPLLRVLFTLVKEQKEGHRVVLREGDVWFADAMAAGNRIDDWHVARSDDPAVILMSGGTTGTPKGVVSDHKALVMSGTQIAAWLREPIEEEGASILLPLPLFHTYGCAGAQSMAFVTGTPLILIPNPREIDDVLKTLKRDQPTLLCAVPTLLSAILNHEDVVSGKISLRSVQACFSGAAALMAETKARFEKITGCRVVEGYSLTEATMACCINPYRGTTKIGSVGMPVADVTVKIVDAEVGKRELGVGEVGEVILNAPQLMRGYSNNVQETAQMLRLDDSGTTWLFTGDLGYLDEDGYLFLVDRKKDVIKTSGFQVWPREVEEVVSTYPGVLEVGVAGLPDERKGEIVAAWVVPESGKSIDVEGLRSYCREKLAPYKVPARVEIRAALPKTMIGKVLRRALVAETIAASHRDALVDAG